MRVAKLAEANRDEEHALRLDQLRDAEQQMTQMRQEYEAMKQQTELHKDAYNYVQKMIEEGVGTAVRRRRADGGGCTGAVDYDEQTVIAPTLVRRPRKN